MSWVTGKIVVTGRILDNKNNSHHNPYTTRDQILSFFSFCVFTHCKDVLMIFLKKDFKLEICWENSGKTIIKSECLISYLSLAWIYLSVLSWAAVGSGDPLRK